MTVPGFETTSLTANSESEKMPAATDRSSESFDEIMIDLDHELASSSLEKAVGPMLTAESPDPPLRVKSSPAVSVPGSGLEDVFAEFKAGFEEDDSEVPDYETHYNLGIAFKEMGLDEEAFAEIQKAL
jgi:hypothetical protein